MKRKRVAALVFSGILASSLAGCTSASDQTEQEATSSTAESTASKVEQQAEEETVSEQAVHQKIGISMPAKQLERWNRDGSYLQKEFEASGYETKLSYSDNDAEKQKEEIRALIADQVDLLIVAAIDGEGLGDVMEEAKNANIPVIAYDRLIMNTDAVIYYISFDNYKVGYLQGQYIEEQLQLADADKKTSYNVEFASGDAADHNASFFFNGAYDVLKPYIDKGVVKVPSNQTELSQTETKGWSTQEANARFLDVLATYYADGTTLDAVVCANDSVAMGVIGAISSDYAGSNTVLITGQDGDEANMACILDGTQSMTVFKPVAEEAYVTAELGEQILQHRMPDETFLEECEWDFECSYDKESYYNGVYYVPSYVLTPVIVTKDNYKKVLVKSGYYTMDGDGKLHVVE